MRVQARVRLVEQHDGRVVDEGARNGEALGHAAGERAGRIVSPVVELDELKQVKDAVAGVGHAVELGEELKVLHGREVAVHHGLVRDEPDAAAQLLGVLERVDAEHGETAGSGTAHGGQDAQKRRLTCAVRPEDGKERTLREVERDAVERATGPKRLLDVVHRKRGSLLHGATPSARQARPRPARRHRRAKPRAGP